MAEGLGEGFGDEMKDVSKSMQNAIPSDFDLDMNGSVSGFNGSSESRTIDLTQPITMNGNVLATIISQIQWSQNTATIRNLGVVK